MATYVFKESEYELSGEQSKGKGSCDLMRHGLFSPVTKLAIGSFWTDCLGGYKLVGKKIFRITPHRHPLIPWARCTKVSLKPFDQIEGSRIALPDRNGLNVIAPCNQLWATLNYALPDVPEGEEEDDQDVLSESWDFSYRNLTLPNIHLKWKSSDKVIRPDELGVFITMPQIDITITRHRVLQKPANSILALMGKINKNPLRLVSDVFPGETCRFDGLHAERKITTSAGLKFYELQYKWVAIGNYGKCKDLGGTRTWAGWNRGWNPEFSMWDQIIWSTDTSRAMYENDADSWTDPVTGAAGFNALFTDGSS